jgi:lipoprotein-anchoring transpeptidase ErfK/SrfK
MRDTFRLRAVVATLLVTGALVACGAAAAATSDSTITVPPTQALALLTRTHRVYSTFRAGRSRIGTVSATRPITSEATVLPVVGRATSTGGTRWLQVMLPGRPNGHRGWITQRGTNAATTAWHLVVRLASRRVLVYERGHLVQSFAAIVGKPSTPTPQGQFFVEEDIALPPADAGAPFALALSARSDALQDFDGGPGQIAIHGLGNLGGTLGTAVSHGCVRLDSQAISWLAYRIAPGTPVTIAN